MAKKLTDDVEHDMGYEMYEYPDFNTSDCMNELINEGFPSNDRLNDLGISGDTKIADYALYRTLLNLNPNKEQIELDLIDNVFLSDILGDDSYLDFQDTLDELKQYYGENVEVEDPYKDTIRLPPDTAKGTYRIGYEFKGTKQIIKYEDNEIFIPAGGFCLYECLQKWINTERDPNYKLDLLNKYSSTNPEQYRNVLKEIGIDEIDTPPIYKPVFDNQNKIWGFKLLNVKTLYKIKDTNQMVIVLMPFMGHLDKKSSPYYHSVIIKNVKLRVKNGQSVIIVKELDKLFNKIIENIKVEQVKTLSDKTKPQRAIQPTKQNDLLFTYDYETSTRHDNGNDKMHTAEGVSLVEFLLSDLDIAPTIEETKIKCFIGSNCTNEMLNHIFKRLEEEGRDKAQIFAHNGGKYDTLILKLAITDPKIKCTSQLSSGGGIKKLKIQKEIAGLNKFIDIKDSLPFLLNTLAGCCDDFKIKEKYNVTKQDFNIIGWTSQMYKDRTDWIEYMKYDSLALAYILIEINKVFKMLNQSVTKNTGLASLAWNIISMSASPCFQEVKIHIDKTTEDFARSAQYGGRIIHFKKEFNEKTIFNCPRLGVYTSRGLICLDANSLYPFIMAMFDFPYGSPQVMNDINKNFEDFKTSLIKNGESPLYIAEIVVDAGNSRTNLIPYRQEKPQLIIYPSGQFSGVYSSVDIDEMIIEGYKILEVKRAIIYPKRSNMFKSIILKLYELRKSNSIYDSILKNILNSMYGKFSESIESYTKYTPSKLKKEIGEIKLNNGQTEFKYKHDQNPVSKPAQIGAFILAYARHHMNFLIRGVGRENIVYGDTDSIYTTIESWEMFLKNNDDNLSERLGGFKNDYGDVLIKKAVFLDTKRYLIEFDRPLISYRPDGTIKKSELFKVKFNGLNFKNKDTIRNWQGSEKTDELDRIRDLFNELKNGGAVSLAVQKWRRIKSEVIIINHQIQKYSSSPESRNQWRENEAYPIGYNFNIPERIGENRNIVINQILTPAMPYIRNLCNNKILINHPIKHQFKNLIDKETNSGEFLADADGKIYKKINSRIAFINPETGKKELMKEQELYFYLSDWGITEEEIEPLKEYKTVLSWPSLHGLEGTNKQVLEYKKIQLENKDINTVLAEKEKKRIECIEKNKVKRVIGI